MTEIGVFGGESVSLTQPAGNVTLVEGSAFCISGPSGDILAGTPQGLFFREARVCSRFELRINGDLPEPLAATSVDPFSAMFVSQSRLRPGQWVSTFLVLRRRYIGRGMREDLVIRNLSEEAAYCAIEVTIDVDFADVFEVKEGRVQKVTEEHTIEVAGSDLVFRWQRAFARRGVRVSFCPVPDKVMPKLVRYECIVPPRGEWSTCIQLIPIIDGEEIEPRYLCGVSADRAAPAERLQRWRKAVPQVATDHQGLAKAVHQSAEDLGALRIFDPDFPERTVVAAGAPWFMTLFGRDSLLTAWMALIVDPELALGVLQTLARFQGNDVDPRNEEEPGRILHQMRFGEVASLSLGGGWVYYGTADATPLFVMLLGELRRWGLAREVVDSLLPHAERALEWIENYGDRDGDGYVEYQRASDRGLYNQGWKDSMDGVRFAHGDIGRPPIALAEVQGYVYGAYLARAHFAYEVGDDDTYQRYAAKAAALKAAFNRDFWLEDKGWYAMGLQGEGDNKKPVDALASNMGHCLWTGIVDADRAPQVARHLLSDDMFSGWGIRTLAQSMVGYNPISYHNGSVWPHDNAICAAGLMRYGFVEEAHRVMMGIIDASVAHAGRLPELFSGVDRREFPVPVAYPSSCSPQAWAAASPLLFLRLLLRLDPWVPYGRLWLDPLLPPTITRLRVDRIPLGGGRLSVEVDGDSVKVEGLPPQLELIERPRDPHTSV